MLIITLGQLPKIFQDIMLAGEIPEEEMKKVFNLGIGYCLVVPEESENDTHDTIDAFRIQKLDNRKSCAIIIMLMLVFNTRNSC